MKVKVVEVDFMKKCKTLILIISFIMIISFFIIYNKKENYIDDNYYVQKNDSLLSMNLEQTAGAGDYKTVTQSKWPTEGYVFNSELSRCENGSMLSWDDTNKSVVVSGNISDKCYVYFDIYVVPTLTSYIKSLYTGTQGENNLYFHNGTLTNDANDNSYRYASADVNVNNYVCFGSSESPCPENNLYRVIGVFEGKVKLIKYSSIGDMYWDDTSSYVWKTASLNTYLNGTFLNSLGNYSSKISTSIWSASEISGGIDDNIKNIFNKEMSDTAVKISAKVGIVYISDLGYATEPINWVGNGWKKHEVGCFGDFYGWTITSEGGGLAWYGNRGTYTNGFVDLDLHLVRPTFYLNSDVSYISGTGAKTDPFIIN